MNGQLFILLHFLLLLMKVSLFLIMLLFCAPAFPQFSFTSILPSRLSGVNYSDTLLNTSTILKREAITKVTAFSVDGQVFSKTEYLITNGRIDVRNYCLKRSPDSTYRLCSVDSIWYNPAGQLVELKAMDAGKNTFLRLKAAHVGEGKVIDTFITKNPGKIAADTATYYRFYNLKGQLKREEQQSKQQKLSDQIISLFPLIKTNSQLPLSF